MESIYAIKVTSIDGREFSLSEYRQRPLLIVNVASECGLTPQYQGLQEIYERFQSRGLLVLGFPCNQFGAQEPGKESEIKAFCESRFRITFPLFAKVEVKGEKAHPLFAYLSAQKAGRNGKAEIEWNFAKFLVSADGSVTERFHPQTEPSEIMSYLERALPS